jgi:hypothetical protein
MKKFIKKYRITVVVMLVFLLSAYGVLLIKQQKLYDKNPGLIPPKGNYDVTLDL